MEYSPVSPVNSVRISPVATSRTVTFALATTAPEGSTMVPRMVPRTLCAQVDEPVPESAANASNNCSLVFIASPLSEVRLMQQEHGAAGARRELCYETIGFLGIIGVNAN